jgi:2-desacetyl-2-hydroxyethyl bacteriochlorophyllide A dehydrogenase
MHTPTAPYAARPNIDHPEQLDPPTTSNDLQAQATTMQAIIQDTYGSPDVLKLQEVDKPEPLAGEVLLRVHASSVNTADWIALTGRPYAARLAFGLVRPKHRIPGIAVAGEVAALGTNVTQFKPGDEVFGEVQSAYAEYVCVPEDRIGPKPTNLTFEEAAAVPLAGITALQGLRDKGRVQPGHQVLINGASGGVGTFAVQIAKALGAEVTGVCSTRNVDTARSLGADHVIDYTREDFTKSRTRFDAILDLAGSRPLADCRRLLTPGGVYVASVGRLGWVAKVAFASLFARQHIVSLTARQTQQDLAVLKEMIESGKVKPVIDRRYTLAEVPDALRYQGQGHAQGKIVITM